MRTIYWIGAVFWMLLGLKTLLPDSYGKVNLMGYNGGCPYSPISTLILFGITGIVLWIGLRYEQNALNGNLKKNNALISIERVR